MAQKTYISLTGLIFLVASLAHLYRVFTGLAVQIGNYTVPVMWSWVGFVVAAFLAYTAFTLKRKQRS